MRKLIFMLVFIPFLGMSQTKNVLRSQRFFCKTDKIQEFKKALAAHAQKYHMGDWKWRVWSINSGPDAGGYMVTEGPSDWGTIDGRGEISTEHQADWDKTVAPLIMHQGSTGYYSFLPDLSTVQLTDYSDKILINHITAKPGKLSGINELTKKLKKVWDAGKESVAVYAVVASGDPGFITVTRLKNGFKELAEGYRKPMADRFNDANGTGSWDAYLKDYADVVEKRWSELLVYEPKLSSK